MIKIVPILKRSWHILWNYRILWLFGILLVLTTGGNWNNNNPSSSTQSTQSSGGIWPPVLPENAPNGLRQFIQWTVQVVHWFNQNVMPVVTHPVHHIGTILLVVGLVLLIGLVIGVLLSLVRYPSETAVMRMVDEYERSGSKMGFRQGWKLGWSRRAFRVWLIDLVLALPILVLVLLLISAGLIVFASVSETFQVTSIIGIVAAIGLAFISLFLIVVAGVCLSLVRNFFVRFAALEGLDVKESLSQGWAMFKRSWKSVGLMWLVMIGVGIVFGIVSLVLFFLFIPAYLVLLIPALLVASLPGLAAFGITSIFASSPLAWIIGILGALPFFLITLFAPMILVGGLYKIYASNIWTLTYREIRVMQDHFTVDLPAEQAQPVK